MEILSHVTPSLHPMNISSVPGYNEEIAPHLATAVEALDTAYQGVDAIHKARQGAATNPTMNDAGRLLVVADFAEKHQFSINKKFDHSMTVLKKNIDAIEVMLNTPLVQSRADGITAEIRAHVKGLSVEERHKFLNEGRPQKLSATPDHFGTVLPLCPITNSVSKNASLSNSVWPKALVSEGSPA